MQFRFIFFLLTFSFSQFHSNEWNSITSYLTPKSISVSNDGIFYMATSGGLLEFNPITNEFHFFNKGDGFVSLDLSFIIKDSFNQFWLGGSYPNGILQVFDINNGIIKKIDYLDEVSEVSLIEIGEDRAYAAYKGFSIGDVGILEFSINERGLPEYKDYYVDFSDNYINEIRDFVYFGDSLFITTDQGIFSANHNDNLKYSNSWNNLYSKNDAIKYLPTDSGNYLITDSLIIMQNGDSVLDLFNLWPYCELPDSNGDLVICPSPSSNDYCTNYLEDDLGKNLGNCGGELLSVDWNDNQFKILYDNLFLVMDNYGKQLYKLEVPYSEWFNYKVKYTSVASFRDQAILGLEGYGFLVFDYLSESYHLYSPNTPHSNEYYAIEFTSFENLVAVSNSGLLIVDNIYSDNKTYKNLLSYPDFKYYPKNYEQNNFYNYPLVYHVGKYPTHSIIEDNNSNLIFGNSYLRPRESWYEFPAVIELNQSSLDFVGYDTSSQIIDGYWGISTNPPKKNMNMIINELTIDKLGHVWITNPYCEKDTHIVAINVYQNQNWLHVKGPDPNSFRPQTIGLNNGTAWIGFAYDVINDYIYSSGGIKVLQYSKIVSDSWGDTSWVTIANPEKLPGNDSNASVWSIVFDKMNFVWVMNDKGIRGYTYSLKDNEIILDPLLKSIDGIAYDFLSSISFVKGNRIRVDAQNNKWIITHQGVWVIQESMAFWPSEEGINTDNSDILSNKIYDIAFDNEHGIAYLATDNGISILQIPFSNSVSDNKQIYISPNPFFIPNDELVIIKNVQAGSIIKISTISGDIIKNFTLPSNQSQFIWDGKDNSGNYVGTAVYLVSSYHSDYQSMVSKIAIVRN